MDTVLCGLRLGHILEEEAGTSAVRITTGGHIAEGLPPLIVNNVRRLKLTGRHELRDERGMVLFLVVEGLRFLVVEGLRLEPRQAVCVHRVEGHLHTNGHCSSFACLIIRHGRPRCSPSR